MKPISWSAGVLVFRYFERIKRYLFVQREDGLIALPSGHQEAKETLDQTAIRETQEETGYLVELICFEPIQVTETAEKYSARVIFLAEITEQSSIGEHKVVWLSPSEMLGEYLAGRMFRGVWQLEGHETTQVLPLSDLAKEVQYVTNKYKF